MFVPSIWPVLFSFLSISITERTASLSAYRIYRASESMATQTIVVKLEADDDEEPSLLEAGEKPSSSSVRTNIGTIDYRFPV